jgi:hypothetical protein
MPVQQGGASVRAEIVAVGAHWSTAQRRLVRLIVELEESGEWADEGSPTCAHWVATALDVEVCTAREWLRVGRALAALPKLDDLFERDELSYSKVRAVTRVATAQNEAQLCMIALREPAGRLPCALAAFLSRYEKPEETERRHREATRLTTTRVEPDGMVVGTFRLPPLPGGRLMAAVDEKVRQRRPDASADASARWPSFPRQRAEALVQLVTEGGTDVQTEVVLHVRGDGCTLDDGTPIADTVVERIAPESFIRALIHDAERRPINASGRHRYPTDRQKRVVHERDRHCACGSDELLQYHHDPPFDVSKRTVVDELWLMCPPCHHAAHANHVPRE